MKNIELKVRINNFLQINTLLKKNHAKFAGILHQIDTYYHCQTGRLKIHQINKQIFELIFYKRPDIVDSKVSTINKITLPAKMALAIQSALANALGKKVEIRKIRKLWMIKHTRVHLDSVRGLGRFVEIETATDSISLPQANEEHRHIIQLLGLRQLQKQSGSYADLMV